MALTKITNSAIADDIGLGGNPTTSTQTAGDSTTRIATTAFVSTAVANLVDSAPDTLNTLAELATSIGNSTTLSSTLTSSIATKLPLAGGTLTGNLNLGDNVRARFGLDSDLEIYHSAGDGHSRIVESGAGRLYINASQINLHNANETENLIKAVADGAVTLYHNGLEKITTTSTGVDVTGNIGVTGTVDGIDIAARDAVLTSTTTTAGAALPLAGGTMTGDLSINYAGNAKATIQAVGDYFPFLDMKRTGASSKTNYAWTQQIGSTGFFYIKDVTNSHYPFILNTSGDVLLSSDTSAANPILTLNRSAGSATFSGNIISSATLSLSGSTMAFDSGNDYMEFNKSLFSPNGYFVGTTGTKVGILQNASGVMNLEAASTRQISFGNETNGEFVRIDDTGNVGIGTNDPHNTGNYNTLDIRGTNGGQILAGRAAYQDFFMYTNTSAANIGSLNDLAFKAGTTGGMTTPSLYLKDGGNVGIGTNNPQHKLDVEGGNNVFDIARFGSSVSDNEEITLGYFNASANNGLPALLAASDFGGLIQGGENGHLVLGIRDNDATDALDIVSGGGNFMTDTTYDTLVATFKANGNVGIGTGSPATKLHASTTGEVYVGTIENLGIAGNKHGLWIKSDSTWSSSNLLKVTAGTSDTDTFIVNPDRVYIAPKVGIGTTSPNKTLEVANAAGGATISISTDQIPGSVTAKKYVTLDFTGYNNNQMAQIQSWDESSSTGYGFLTFSTRQNNSSLVEAMRINQLGNVGIGTDNPLNKFVVAHESHGVAIDYVGATLPYQAGLFTSSSALTQTAYGDLNIKSRSDYTTYGIGFFTANVANTPTLRMKIAANGETTVNSNILIPGAQLKQGTSDGTPRHLVIPYGSTFTFAWNKLSQFPTANAGAATQNSFVFEVNVSCYLHRHIKALVTIDTNLDNSISVTTVSNSTLTMTATIPTGSEVITLSFGGIWGNSTNWMGRVTTF